MRYLKKLLLISAGLVFTLAVSAQNISLRLNNVSVKEAIAKVKKNYGYKFVFSPQVLNTKKIVSLNVTMARIDEVMRQVLQDQPNLDYKVQGKTVIIMRRQNDTDEPAQVKKNVSEVRKSTKSLNGTVTDEKGEPVIGASVRVKGATIGTVTNIDGRFTDKANKGDVLNFSYIGYDEQSYTLGNRQNINITLRESAETLDEVVVVGYGTMKKA
jgi:type II secretory pathway component GspD/PulD (secretin)